MTLLVDKVKNGSAGVKGVKRRRACKGVLVGERRRVGKDKVLYVGTGRWKKREYSNTVPNRTCRKSGGYRS